MKRMKSVLLFTLSVFVIGCAGESSAPASAESPAETPAEPAIEASAPEVDDAALIAEGKQLFETTAICFTCHGPDASGTTLAPDLTDAEWLNIEAPADLEKLSMIIKTGVAEPKQFQAPMPPMSTLTDDQVKAVATYVLSLGA